MWALPKSQFLRDRSLYLCRTGVGYTGARSILEEEIVFDLSHDWEPIITCGSNIVSAIHRLLSQGDSAWLIDRLGDSSRIDKSNPVSCTGQLWSSEMMSDPPEPRKERFQGFSVNLVSMDVSVNWTVHSTLTLYYFHPLFQGSINALRR